MKYSKKYPNMAPILEEEKGVIRGEQPEPCHYCGEDTEYIDINYEARFCSEECLEEFEEDTFDEDDHYSEDPYDDAIEAYIDEVENQ